MSQNKPSTNPVPNKPGQQNPGQKPGNNENISQPNRPDNDPDQTPDREVHKVPQAPDKKASGTSQPHAPKK